MYIAVHTDADRKAKALIASTRFHMNPREFILQVMVPIWLYAAEQDKDGELPNLDNDMLTAITFGRADSIQGLVETGWLVEKGGKLFVHDWLEHQPYFKKRAYDKARHMSSHESTRTHTNPHAKEKKREENKRKEKKKNTKKASVVLEIPEDLKPFEAEIREWLQFKKEKRQQYTPTGLKGLWDSCRDYGLGLPEAVKHSIANNFTGLYPPRQSNSQPVRSIPKRGFGEIG